MFRSLVISFVSLFMLPVAALSQDEPAAASKAVDFFNSAPLDVAGNLSQISRLDMVDYFVSGSTFKSENQLGAKVALKSLGDEMVVWQDDDSVSTAIVVLPSASPRADTLLMVIRTIGGPMPDSEVSFYDSGWNEIRDLRGFPRPALKDWVKPAVRRMLAEIGETLPFMLATAGYDAETRTLTLTNRMDSYYVAGDKPDCLALIRPELRYVWNGRSFVAYKEK